MAARDIPYSSISEEMRILRSQWNALSPICRLPREIIETVFFYTACDHCNDCPTSVRRLPSWVNISYVCRHWRSVALGCPALWGYHFVLSLRWTEELLARSKQAPLKIHLNFHEEALGSWYLKHLKKLMKHSERFQTFRLHVTYDSRSLSNLSSPAPHLTSLDISDKSENSAWPPALFLGNTPALCNLKLSGCPVPWYLFNQSTLTSLSLHDVPEEIQQTTEEFLPVLGSLQNLTYLCLDNALPSATQFISSTSFQTFQTIKLPELSHLWIIAPLSTVVAMLSHVEIPPNTELRLEYSPEDDSPNHYPLLSSVLAQRFTLVSKDPALPKMTIDSLLVDFSSANNSSARLTFNAMKYDWDTSLSMPHVQWDPNIPLKVVIRDNFKINDAVEHLCCSMPLGNVQNAHIIAPPFSQAFWRKIFGHLKSLRYLKLSRGKIPDIALVLSHPAMRDASAGHILVPYLRQLVLYRIRFAPGYRSDADAQKEHTITEQSLMRALSTRNTSQGQLIFDQCVCYSSGNSMMDKVRSWDGTITVDEVKTGW